MSFLKKFFSNILMEEKSKDKVQEIFIKEDEQENFIEETDGTYYKLSKNSPVEKYEIKLKDKYKEYVGKEINGWKILRIETLTSYPYMIPVFDCECLECGIVVRLDTDKVIEEEHHCAFCVQNYHKYSYEFVSGLKENIPVSLNVFKHAEYELISGFAHTNNIMYCILNKNEEYEKIGIFNIKQFTFDYIIGDFRTYNTKKKEYVTIKNVFCDLNEENNILILKKNGVAYSRCEKKEILYVRNCDDIRIVAIIQGENGEKNLVIYDSENELRIYNNINKIKYFIDDNNIIIENENGFNSIFDIEKLQKYQFNFKYLPKINDYKETLIEFTIDVNNSNITDRARKIIEPLLKDKTDFTKCKKLYFERDITQKNMVLYKFLENKKLLEKVDNEFEDDKTELYMAKIEWEDLDTLELVEYIRNLAIERSVYKYTIYGVPISEIAFEILKDFEMKMKICELIKKEKIFIVKNKDKTDNFISWIINQSQAKGYSKDVINIIIERLCAKYVVDKFNLLIILIAKYGQENVFKLPTSPYLEFDSKGFRVSTINKKEVKKRYDEILVTIDEKEIKWKSEFKMFKLIKRYFEDAIYQYRFTELGLQSLDVFIPELNVGFEYQGLQHYQAVEVFGGEEHYRKQHENDLKKKKICEENNIDLIEWRYDEEVNKINLDKKLLKYKEKVNGKYIFSELE